MDVDIKQEETTRQTILREQKIEAEEKHICLRCLSNGGLRIEVTGEACSNCGALWNTKLNKI